MEQQRRVVFLLALVVAGIWACADGAKVIDIQSLGVAPGGDITEALDQAWKEAIASPEPVKITIGPGEWTLKQAKLQGPNKSPVEIEVKGTLKALTDPRQMPNPQWEWVTVNYVNYFTLSGGGVLDGMGPEAWKTNDCHKNKNCAKLPYNLSFNFINNSIIQDITTKDSKNFHANCISSGNVTFLRYRVSAPGESPNTDGLHIARGNGISIIDSVIETGDDCISMGDELTDVMIKNVRCGPGHGISIGSLGRSTTEKDISRVTVENCTFIGTDNGVRIKTWPSAPATLTITDLTFVDLIMENVSNPVVIDQQYCPWNMCTLDKPSLIQVSKVKVNNVKGTSRSADVITFSCSSAKPCKEVRIGDIDLKYIGDPKLGPATTKCENVEFTFTGGAQNPPVCAKASAGPVHGDSL